MYPFAGPLDPYQLDLFSVYQCAETYRLSCSGQLHGRSCSRHCSQTGLIIVIYCHFWLGTDCTHFPPLHYGSISSIHRLPIGDHTFCLRERQVLHAIVIREPFFAFDKGAILHVQV